MSSDSKLEDDSNECLSLPSTSSECSKPALERNDFTTFLVNSLMVDDVSEEDLVKLKKLESKLAEKVDKGHFRCKVKHAKIYEQLTDIHRENTTLDLLKMVNHGYDTQGVEAMNKSASALAPKGETFSKTMALTTRLDLACAAQIIGYEAIWKRIYESMGIRFRYNLTHFFTK